MKQETEEKDKENERRTGEGNDAVVREEEKERQCEKKKGETVRRRMKASKRSNK